MRGAFGLLIVSLFVLSGAGPAWATAPAAALRLRSSKETSPMPKPRQRFVCSDSLRGGNCGVRSPASPGWIQESVLASTANAAHMLASLTQVALVLTITFGGVVAMAGSAMQPQAQIVVPNTPEHSRNGEADIIQLKNGDLLLGYGRWGTDGDDFGAAEIWSKTSHDCGKTWGEDRVLVPNEGKLTTFEVAFLRLQSGEILLAYCVKDSTEDCSICFRKSRDEGRTWVERVKYRIPREYTGYTAINNDRLVQLKGGRILLPAYDGWVHGRMLLAFVLYSDDNGATWRKSSDVDARDIDPSDKFGAGEPAVVELKDGRLLMIIRTGLGIIAKSYSRDGGATWSRCAPIKGIVAPNAPSSVARLPGQPNESASGDLLLVWNNTTTARDPLNCAISRDEGETWRDIRVLDRGGSLCYTSITPVDDRVLLTYYKFPEGLKLQAIPARWFYEKE
jgi:hypothetical protein